MARAGEGVSSHSEGVERGGDHLEVSGHLEVCIGSGECWEGGEEVVGEVKRVEGGGNYGRVWVGT